MGTKAGVEVGLEVEATGLVMPLRMEEVELLCLRRGIRRGALQREGDKVEWIGADVEQECGLPRRSWRRRQRGQLLLGG